MKRSSSRILLGILLPLVFGAGPSLPAAPLAGKIPPTFRNVAYGDSRLQKFDIYRPGAGTGPFPILLWIHPGGLSTGDKSGPIPRLPDYLAAGCAVVSINHRLASQALAQKVNPPFRAVFDDDRRALQFLRLHAAEWNLDPARIVVAGSSGGGCSALYLGCEGERAEPDSSDPVQRVSTLVLGVGASAAQTTIDPQRMREWVPGVTWETSGFGYPDSASFDQILAERSKWLPAIEKYSPELLLSKDTPPLYFQYSEKIPDPARPPPSNLILVHCPLWAIGFAKIATAQGVTCYLNYPGHPDEHFPNMFAFLLHQLGLSAAAPIPS